MSTKTNIFGLRLSAILEIILGLVLLVAIDQLFFAGDMFWDVNPHPFWIVVIIVAAQYGANEALLAALASSVVYLLGPWPEPAAEGDIFSYYYGVLINPILWFAFGLLAGVFTERHLRKVVRLSHDLGESREREETITESYNFVKNRKEDLETQIAGRLTSSVQAYKAAKSIETLNPKDVLRGVEDLVSAIINPQKFSVYTLHDNKLSTTIIHGWNQNDSFSQELDSYSALYQAVIGNQRTLCIANEEHEQQLDRQGVLAGPIIDSDTNRVIGMLKIEQMDFVNLNLNTIETFKALCEWIGTSLKNAENYQAVKEDSVVNPDHNLMTYNFFKRQSDYLSSLAKRVGFDLSMIVVRIADADKLEESDRLSIARKLSESVKGALRNVDLAFEYQTTGEEYSILLPATSQEGANVVRDKIAKDLDKASLGAQGSFSYIVQSIHEAA